VRPPSASAHDDFGSDLIDELNSIMVHTMAREIPPLLLVSLAQRGWARHAGKSTDVDTTLDEVRRMGSLIGSRAGGRARALEEVVRPLTFDAAHPRSLSAQFGLNALPFHAELSHRPRPCRYLLLGCLDPGSQSAVTTLLDWRTLGFSSEDFRLLETAPVLVRSGRRSFYSTVLPRDRAFLRYDPGCLEAVDERGRFALRLLANRLALCSPDIHEWKRGDILIIDNWRTLHGRGPSTHGSDRRLVRILLNA
jgi:hypothetical protein